jgi:PAS domain S-box-containing protein
MEKLRVLNLEADENDGERIRAELETGWKDIELMRVDTREAFVRALEEFKPDVILSDFQLPGFDSSSVLDIVRQTHPDIPVIIITGALTDSEAVKLVKMGARDYVTKDRLRYLVSAVQGALSIEQGIRARKAEEQALRQSEADIRALIEHSPIAMIVDVGVGADEKVVMMNRKFTELFGYTLEDIPDMRHWWSLAYPNEAYRKELMADWTERVENIIRSHGNLEPKEVTITCKGGSNRYVRISLASIRSQNILAFEDLTERKQAEESLRISHTRFSTIFNQAPLGIALIDSLTGKIQEVNPRFAEIAGRTIEEMATIDWMSITHPDDVQEDLDNMALLNAGKIPGFNMNKRYIRPDGSIAWINMTIAPLRSEQNISPHHLCMIDDITAHKQADDRLTESERYFRAVAESANDAIVTISDTGGIVDWNNAAEQLFGRNKAEMTGLPLAALIPERFLGPHSTGLARVVAGGTPNRIGKTAELAGLRKDGSEFPLELSLAQWETAAGKFSTAIIRDITERKLNEEALRASQARYVSLFNAIADAVFVHATLEDGAPGKFLEVNEVACRQTGYSRDELLNMTPVQLDAPDSGVDLMPISKRLLAGEHVAFEQVHLAKDGQRIPVEIHAHLFMLNGSQTVISLARDITERKKAEWVLWESEERYRSLFENMLEGYAHCKMLFEQDTPQDFIYINVNRAFEKITGLKDVVGKKATEVIPGIRASNPELFEIYGRVALTGQPERFDTNMDALGIWLSITVYSTQKGHFVAVFDDITGRKRFEAQQALEYQHIAEINMQLTEANKQLKLTQNQLLHSAKMASIGLLAAGVAHEINNPIGYVNSNMGTLEKYLADIFAVIDKFEAIEMLMGMLVDADDPLLEELRQFKEQINLGYIRKDIKALIAESHQGLERVKNIVLDLKNFSHIDSEDQWMWADMHHVLDTTLNVIWNELKYKCEVVKEFGVLPKIYCLPSQLEQVFMNLLENAAHAIEVRGKITIRTGQEGNRIWVEVSDTGKGIPPEYFPHLFDPFFTTKPVGKGTGLGLSVSYSIVEKHHGKIEVRSEVGKGSVFRVWLPVQQPDLKEEA